MYLSSYGRQFNPYHLPARKTNHERMRTKIGIGRRLTIKLVQKHINRGPCIEQISFSCFIFLTLRFFFFFTVKLVWWSPRCALYCASKMKKSGILVQYPRYGRWHSPEYPESLMIEPGSPYGRIRCWSISSSFFHGDCCRPKCLSWPGTALFYRWDDGRPLLYVQHSQVPTAITSQKLTVQ
jgi:hypothetical protein